MEADEPSWRRVLAMPLIAGGAWAGGLLVGAPGAALVGIAAGALAVLAALTRPRLRRVSGLLAASLLALGSVLALGSARDDITGAGAVSSLAEHRAVVRARLVVTSDPVVRSGRFDDYVVARGVVRAVAGRGSHWAVRTPVLVVAPTSWSGVELGSTADVLGRLAPSDEQEVAAMFSARGSPSVVRRPSPWWQGAGAVRASVREAVAGRPLEQRALVPALVDGDDGGFPDDLADDFRTTGMTHLLAVSGTNLTLVAGFLVLLARWCGIRGRGLVAVGAVGIVGFVLLARGEPSVLRAAAMGTVGLVALSRNGTRRGVRGLSVAVLVLLLVEPPLARSPGFVLSVLATGGIVVLGPRLRDALTFWLPRWAAEAVAVPTAAQLLCTPVVAGLSGQVSLVAVAANLVAAPAVAPTTLLGLAGGLLGLVWTPLGAACGWFAGLGAAWLVVVARAGASLQTPAVDWGTGWWSLALLTVLCAATAFWLPRLLRRRWLALGTSGVLSVVMLVPVPVFTPGWPPKGWVMVMCDVGQGDGLVLNAGAGAAVVVDVGPDPVLMRRCLARLRIRDVPLVVLTHFHADHVDGLAGVLDGHRVGEVDVTARGDPVAGAERVLAESAGRTGVRLPAYAETRRIGPLTLQVLGPGGAFTSGHSHGDGTGPNNASIVLLVETAGVRILLAGDVEPDAQHALARAWPGLRVDVLKVPHHGSRYQDLDWLLGLGARLALVSVGTDNDYGHPSAEVLQPLQASGAVVRRTDLDGDVAVVVRDGRTSVDTR